MTDAPFADLFDRVDAFLTEGPAVSDLMTQAEVFLDDAESVVEAWLAGKGQVPTDKTSEGFRLLALHRQAAKGDPSFNACRETCREIVFLRNVIAQYDGHTAQALHHLRLQAMVLRHLALFVGGKMQESGLGDFCCSSRPVRMAGATG